MLDASAATSSIMASSVVPFLPPSAVVSSAASCAVAGGEDGSNRRALAHPAGSEAVADGWGAVPARVTADVPHPVMSSMAAAAAGLR